MQTFLFNFAPYSNHPSYRVNLLNLVFCYNVNATLIRVWIVVLVVVVVVVVVVVDDDDDDDDDDELPESIINEYSS